MEGNLTKYLLPAGLAFATNTSIEFNKKICEVLEKHTLGPVQPPAVKYTLLININPRENDGGLFAFREILYEIIKEYNPFVIAVCAPPGQQEWIDWAYAVGIDVLLFYVDTTSISSHRFSKILDRALRVFPKGNVGIIIENAEELYRLPEINGLPLITPRNDCFYLICAGNGGIVGDIFKNIFKEKHDRKKDFILKFKYTLFKLRRSLRVVQKFEE